MNVTEVTSLIKADELAKMLSVSPRHIWRMKAKGKLPKTVSVGGCVRWLLADIQLFLNLGCPDRQQFEAIKAAGKRGC
jgi:predicted DNA-binding transcriptional regulator AlpA